MGFLDISDWRTVQSSCDSVHFVFPPATQSCRHHWLLPQVYRWRHRCRRCLLIRADGCAETWKPTGEFVIKYEPKPSAVVYVWQSDKNIVWFFVDFLNYYRVMLRRAWYCHGKLSVHPSVYDVEVLWSPQMEETSKIISRLISLGRPLSAFSTLRICSKENNPKFQLEQYWGIEKLPLGDN